MTRFNYLGVTRAADALSNICRPPYGVPLKDRLYLLKQSLQKKLCDLPEADMFFAELDAFQQKCMSMAQEERLGQCKKLSEELREIAAVLRTTMGDIYPVPKPRPPAVPHYKRSVSYGSSICATMTRGNGRNSCSYASPTKAPIIVPRKLSLAGNTVTVELSR